jgi:uncharacterized protein
LPGGAVPCPDVRLTVRGHPGARRDEVGGRYGTDEPPVLIVRVAVPATGGRANERLVRVLASSLGVPVRAVTIVTGASARTKVVEVSGADPALRDRLLAR